MEDVEEYEIVAREIRNGMLDASRKGTGRRRERST